MEDHRKKADIKEKLKEKINGERLHGRLQQDRWQDSMLGQSKCFAWLQHWICAPTHITAGVLGAL